MIFLNLFLSSCLARGKYSTVVQNVSIDELYFHDIYVRYIPNSLTDHQLTRYSEDKEFGEKNKLYELKRGKDYGLGIDHGLNREWKFQQIDFYYKSKSCFLFSYTREQLVKLKTDAGFKEDDHNVGFFVEKNGLRVVSGEEYRHPKIPAQPIVLNEKEVCKKYKSDRLEYKK